jgi:hypothetical protein
MVVVRRKRGREEGWKRREVLGLGIEGWYVVPGKHLFLFTFTIYTHIMDILYM